jgi:hypothetical protein
VLFGRLLDSSFGTMLRFHVFSRFSLLHSRNIAKSSTKAFKEQKRDDKQEEKCREEPGT